MGIILNSEFHILAKLVLKDPIRYLRFFLRNWSKFEQIGPKILLGEGDTYMTSTLKGEGSKTKI